MCLAKTFLHDLNLDTQQLHLLHPVAPLLAHKDLPTGIMCDVSLAEFNNCEDQGNPLVSWSTSSETLSQQSTSSIALSETSRNFKFYADEQAKEVSTTDRVPNCSTLPTPRSIANSINVLDHQWSLKQNSNWTPLGSDLPSFFCVKTDLELECGSNTEPSTCPSTENTSPMTSHNFRSTRTLFGNDAGDQASDRFGAIGPPDNVSGGDNYASYGWSPPSSPTFSEPLSGYKKLNSYGESYEANQHIAHQFSGIERSSEPSYQRSENPYGLRSRTLSPPVKNCDNDSFMRQSIQKMDTYRPQMAESDVFASQQPIHRQHPHHQMSYTLPVQSQRLSGYPTIEERKRCNSFSGQSSQPAAELPYLHRQSYPSLHPERRGVEPERNDQISQYMMEAQSHMRSQLLFQQQRLHEQHLQQQQLQQLHRLHTQQLKQVKQKNLEFKANAADRSAVQSRVVIEGPIYQVQFKCSHRYMTLSESAPQGITVGSFVVVEADRGEDLGIVVCIAPANSALSISLNAANNANAKGAEGELKKILRLATLQERAELPNKAKDETDILKICREWAPEKYNLSILLEDAEYQFDRHKLVLYYSAARRIDFREFVRDLYAVYKTRIWMQPTDANVNFRPNEAAARALATGFPSQSPLQSSVGQSPVSFEIDSQRRLNTLQLPPPSMTSGSGGGYGENSLRSCPPSIPNPIYWVARPTQSGTAVKQATTAPNQRSPEATDRTRVNVNSALYQHHQQLQYGSSQRPVSHY